MHDEKDASISQTVARAQEIARRNRKQPGHFFRYTSVDNLQRLIDQGELHTDGKVAFNNFVEGKFNPKKYSSEAMLSYYVIRALQEFVSPISEVKANLVLTTDPMRVLSTVEQLLIAENPNFKGITESVRSAVKAKSTSPIIEYFKKIGGDWLMVKLERSGGATPNHAFSDLLPLSAGAPVAEIAGSQLVMLELDFDESQLVIPENLGIPDNIAEHEVLTPSITLKNLTNVYWEGNFHELRARMQREFPEYFHGNAQNPYEMFASQVPLSEVLATVTGKVSTSNPRR